MHSRHKGHAIQLILILLLIAIPANAGQIVVGYGSSTTWIPKNDANCKGAWYMDGATSADETDRSSGGTTLTHHGTLTSSTDVPSGYSGKSRTFVAGSGQWFDAVDGGSTDINGASNLTIAMWIKVNTAPTSGNHGGLMSKWVTGQLQYRISVRGSGSSQFNISAGISSDGSTSLPNVAGNLLSTNVYNQATWYHVAFVYNHTDMRIYVNGSLDCTPYSTSVNIFNGTDTFNVGRQGGASYLDGLMDEVIIFDRALSSTEISNLYNNGISGNKGGSD